jgi:hypothetical protein
VAELPDWVAVGASVAWTTDHNRYVVTTIERHTATQIITADGQRFRKASYCRGPYEGRGHFSRTGDGRWPTTWRLIPGDDPAIYKSQLKALASNLHRKVEKVMEPATKSRNYTEPKLTPKELCEVVRKVLNLVEGEYIRAVKLAMKFEEAQRKEKAVDPDATDLGTYDV